MVNSNNIWLFLLPNNKRHNIDINTGSSKMKKNFKQTSIRDNRKSDGTWTKLIEMDGTIIIKQFDGEDVETIVLNLEDIKTINNIIKE